MALLVLAVSIFWLSVGGWVGGLNTLAAYGYESVVFQCLALLADSCCGARDALLRRHVRLPDQSGVGYALPALSVG